MTPREALRRALFRGARIEGRTTRHVLVARGDRRTTVPLFGAVIPAGTVALIERDLALSLRSPIRARDPRRRPAPTHPGRPPFAGDAAAAPARLADGGDAPARRSLDTVFAWEGRWWIASIPAVPGCHTYAAGLARASARLLDALALWDVAPALGPGTFELPDDVATLVEDAAAARRRADLAARNAIRATTRAADHLAAVGMSLRDTATLLDLSHQRIQQLLTRGSSPTPG